MKIAIYIVTLLVMVVAAYFTSSNIQPHQDELDKTNDLKGNIERIERNIRDKVKDIKAMKGLKSEQQDIKNDNIGKIDLGNTKKRGLAKQSAGFDGKLSSLTEQKEEIEAIIQEIKNVFEEQDIPIEEVANYFEQMEDEKKQLNKSHVSLLSENDRFSEAVKSKKKELVALVSAASKRRDNLKANGVSSLITAVDNDWGFVVLKPHQDSLIKQDSKLIVVRGSKHVGRLTINAIEKERVLANIDYKSIVPGMRIRPGDRVILSEAVTR